ncbi:hypothetical protein I3843_11G051900 [Carya illinoinensis]|nr:hypothetical protein I3843_11G051900 [Carya illinoinensis]
MASTYGPVEIWMNEHVQRLCTNNCADFVYGFLETSSKKRSEYWLIWQFEGEATVSDLMQSKEFTYNVGTSSHKPFHIVYEASILHPLC